MDLQYLRNVTTLELKESLCVGCKMCIEVCPRDVFVIEDKKVKISKKDNCIECGACSKNCPSGAISVNAGVGCAAALYNGFFNGGEVSCDCSSKTKCC